jgi:hypothetical protein
LPCRFFADYHRCCFFYNGTPLTTAFTLPLPFGVTGSTILTNKNRRVFGHGFFYHGCYINTRLELHYTKEKELNGPTLLEENLVKRPKNSFL